MGALSDSRPVPFAGHVRAAGVADAVAIARLRVGLGGGQLAARTEALRGELERVAAGARRYLWVAEEPSVGVLGFGRTRFWEPQEFLDLEGHLPEAAGPRGWYLAGVTVEPGHRRRGVWIPGCTFTGGEGVLFQAEMGAC